MMDYNPDQCPVCEGPMKDWRAVEMSAWQPIETAPKNGTRILLLGKEYGDPKISIGAYQDNRVWSDESTVTDDGCGWVGHDNWSPDPSHWMPLPSPPTDD